MTAEIPASEVNNTHGPLDGASHVEFGSGDSMGDGWGIPFGGAGRRGGGGCSKSSLQRVESPGRARAST